MENAHNAIDKEIDKYEIFTKDSLQRQGITTYDYDDNLSDREYINPSDSTFYDLMDRIGFTEAFDKEAIKEYRAAFLAGGMPYFKAHDKPIRANFKKGKKDYGFFGPAHESILDILIEQHISPRTYPDTINYSGEYFSEHENPLQDSIAELAHAIMENKSPLQRAISSSKLGKERRAHGEDVYTLKDSHEHNTLMNWQEANPEAEHSETIAHSYYEPYLREGLLKAIERDTEYTNYPTNILFGNPEWDAKKILESEDFEKGIYPIGTKEHRESIFEKEKQRGWSDYFSNNAFNFIKFLIDKVTGQEYDEYANPKK